MSQDEATAILPIREPPQSGVTTPRATRPEDVENGLRFLHLADAKTQARLSEVASTVQALAEALIADGQLSLET